MGFNLFMGMKLVPMRLVNPADHDSETIDTVMHIQEMHFCLIGFNVENSLCCHFYVSV